MIEITSEHYAGIECLHAAPAEKRSKPLPTVVFYHGFTSSKEVYAYFAVALAQIGIRAILPDADMHGARFSGDGAQRLSHLWDIVKKNIDELPTLEAALCAQGLIEKGRLGVAGASMGGMTALGAMARYPHLRAVASMMGSGYFMSLSHTLFPPLLVDSAAQKEAFDVRMAPLAEYDVSHQLEALSDRPLLLWHGEADGVVPAAESARLEAALRETQRNTHLTYITEKGVGHRITPPALNALTSFFTHHL